MKKKWLFIFLLSGCNPFVRQYRDTQYHLSSQTQTETSLAEEEKPIDLQVMDHVKQSVWEIRNNLILEENKITIRENENYPRIDIKKVTDTVPLGHGTAFFISPQLMITNFHVIDNINKNTEIVCNRDKSADETIWTNAKLLKVSSIYDLALLESEKSFDSYLTIRDTTPDLVRHGRFFLFAYPDNRFISTKLKYYTDRFNKNIFIFHRDFLLGSLKGSSGGPVVDENGELVAVNHAGSSKQVIAISFKALNDFLNGNHRDCLKYPSSEECIEREWEYLKQADEKGYGLAQYKLSFGDNYARWLKKRQVFKHFIETQNRLNQEEAELIKSQIKWERSQKDADLIKYNEQVQGYNQVVREYNQAVSNLNQLAQ